MEITNRRPLLARQDLRSTVVDAEPHLAEIKARFFSAAAHELRTPLTTMIGYLEMLLDGEFGPLSEGQREPLKAVSESAWHLRCITNNLLAAARIEAGQAELNVQSTDLLWLVKSVMADLEPHLAAKAQHLELSVSSNLPPALCDEERATQIICNLLDKACERTAEGGSVRVGVALAEEEGFLQVAVAYGGAVAEGDAGEPGCSPAVECNGAGETGVDSLGLYVTRSLVELQGGRLWHTDGRDESGMACVTFPIASEAAAI
jgi:signal transduction histidine kinase